jgi:hypothetical protein
MSNLVRARNRQPFDFQDGLKIMGIDINTKVNTLVQAYLDNKNSSGLTSSQITNALGFTPVNKAGDNITGNLSVSGTLTANGDILSTNGNVTAFSDEKLKKDWTTLPNNFIEQLSNIKSGIYTRIDTGTRQSGVSAQDLKKILPEAVIGEDTLSVAYGNAAMVSVVELAKANVKYVNMLDQLFSVIKVLESRVEKLER